MVSYNQGGFKSPSSSGAMHYLMRSVVEGDAKAVDDACAPLTPRSSSS